VSAVDRLLEQLQRVSIKIHSAEEQLRELRREQSRIKAEIKGQIRLMASGASDDAAPQRLTASDALSQTVEIVRSSGRPMSVSDIVERMQLSRPAANLRLSRAVQAGHLRRAGKGFYVAVTEDSSASANGEASHGSANGVSIIEETPDDDDIPF
jgi:hypothetical protein